MDDRFLAVLLEASPEAAPPDDLEIVGALEDREGNVLEPPGRVPVPSGTPTLRPL